MRKFFLPFICLLFAIASAQMASAKVPLPLLSDSTKTLNPEVLKLVSTVLTASYTFKVEKVTDLYAPNAVVTDEQAPYSWNGQLAGVQWINSVQKAVKDFKIRDFKVNIKHVKIFQQTDEIAYLIVPVEYTGTINGDPFDEEGAFSFVLRVVSGSWLIKSQAWVPKNGL